MSTTHVQSVIPAIRYTKNIIPFSSSVSNLAFVNIVLSDLLKNPKFQKSVWVRKIANETDEHALTWDILNNNYFLNRNEFIRILTKEFLVAFTALNVFLL